jgi:hypothetical protein
MAIVVEDGNGLADSVAYVSIATVVAFATSRGLSFSSSTTSQEAAIVRATAYIDARYGSVFSGTALKGRTQALRWPRLNAIDIEGNSIASNAVPREIAAATSEAAIRELASPNSLSPDYERGGKVKTLKAGSVEVTYQDGATAETIVSPIDNALAGLIVQRKPGQISSSLMVRT